MSHVISPGKCFVQEPVVLDQPAADFTAEAYCRGQRIDVQLSQYCGKWVVLFFYANDFTFV